MRPGYGPDVIGVILFMALGFIVGWAVQHPLAWAVLLVPVLFVVAAGDDAALLPAILGVVLMAAAFYAGRVVARNHRPDEPAEESQATEPGRPSSPVAPLPRGDPISRSRR